MKRKKSKQDTPHPNQEYLYAITRLKPEFAQIMARVAFFAYTEEPSKALVRLMVSYYADRWPQQ